MSLQKLLASHLWGEPDHLTTWLRSFMETCELGFGKSPHGQQLVMWSIQQASPHPMGITPPSSNLAPLGGLPLLAIPFLGGRVDGHPHTLPGHQTQWKEIQKGSSIQNAGCFYSQAIYFSKQVFLPVITSVTKLRATAPLCFSVESNHVDSGSKLPFLAPEGTGHRHKTVIMQKEP